MSSNWADDFGSGGDFAGGGSDIPPEHVNPRRMLVVLLDCSYSMGQPEGNPPIEELKAAMKDFFSRNGDVEELRPDTEIAIAVFSQPQEAEARILWVMLGVPVVEDSKFYWARNIPLPNANGEGGVQLDGLLKPSGGTPIGEAVVNAVSKIEQRVAQAVGKGHSFHPRPALLVLTDGKPTDDISAAIQATHRLEENGQLVFWIAATSSADLETLRPLANKGNLIELGDRGVGAFIRLMSMTPGAEGRTAQAVYDRILQKWQDSE